MRIVKLFWKSRVAKKRKAKFIQAAKTCYNEVRDCGDYARLKVPNDCTKFLWMFMLSKLFKDLK